MTLHTFGVVIKPCADTPVTTNETPFPISPKEPTASTPVTTTNLCVLTVADPSAPAPWTPVAEIVT